MARAPSRVAAVLARVLAFLCLATALAFAFLVAGMLVELRGR